MAFFEGIKMTGGYGNGPDIIHSCSVTVDRGEIVSILGPNGAGKSTAMKAMLGLLNLKSGTITIDGKDISNLSPQDRVKQGISFVPQTKNVFAGMTVEENLEMGAFLLDKDLKKLIDDIEKTTIPKFPYDGKFLIDKGFSEGKKIGLILKKLEKNWVENNYKLTEKDISSIIEKESKSNVFNA